MKKRIALLVYPDFSLQEVSNLMYLFRWNYETMTDVIYTDIEPVTSEEGISVLPQKTCDEFCCEDYDCLILPAKLRLYSAAFPSAMAKLYYKPKKIARIIGRKISLYF